MNQQDVLEKACDELGVMVPQIISTKGWRWTITQPSDNFFHHALKLERIIQRNTKRPIELLFEPQADKNKRAGRNGRE
jgi:hypothetical protein